MEVPAGLPEARVARAEADALAVSFDRDVKRALILWVIRWVIGFLLIWFITGVSGGLSWLWWVGVIGAIGSLVATMALKRRMSRKLDRLNEAFDDLERTLRRDDG